MQIFKRKTKAVKKNYHLEEQDSEFTPTKPQLEQDEITKTLTGIDRTLSSLNNHRW